MAHELDITNDVVSFADSRDDAWHQLGQKVSRCMTAEEVMEEAMLGGWNVRKHRLWTEGDDGFPLQITDRVATVRTNPVTGNTDYLGVVGPNYRPIQNEESAAFLNALVDESGAHFETAGALRGGRNTFVTLRLPEYMVFEGKGGVRDSVDLYIAALNAHDGGGAFRVLTTPVRIVCANTESAAIRGARSSWSTRHTLNALAAIEEARQSLEITFAYADAFAQEMQALIDREMDRDRAEHILRGVFNVGDAETDRQEAVRKAHVSKVMEGLSLPTVRGFEDTAYGLYNAVTEYIDHRIEVRGGFGAPAYSAIEGTYADVKLRAFELISA
jgi:phage/plasmid-like protein (TIGR03299 family)